MAKKKEAVDETLKIALDRQKQAELGEQYDRDKMEDDLQFLVDQWPAHIRRQREAANRPCLTIDRMNQFLRQTIGRARQNKPAIKVRPVDEGSDPKTAEVLDGLIRNIEVQSRADIPYLTGLEHALRGGRGAWRVTTEYTDDDTFDQDVRIRRIPDPRAVFFDTNAIEYDKSDANWAFVLSSMTKEAFEAKYPTAKPADWEQEYKAIGRSDWIADERVKIAEYWVKKPREKEIAALPSGAIIDWPGGPAPEGVKLRKVKSHTVCRYVLAGHAVLEGPQEFPSKYIPIVPVFGPEEFQNGQNIHISLIRHAKDAQRLFNFWRTSNAEKIALAPKAPFIGTVAQIAPNQQMWDNANVENRSVLTYTPDPLAPGMKPERQMPAPMNVAEIQESQQSIDDIKASMGIYDASLGNAGNETSGRAINARQQQGDDATFEWLDNWARSIGHTGRILIDVISRIYDTPRIARILGEDGSVNMVPVNGMDPLEPIHDLTVGKYDVVCTVGPSYATKRMEAADSMIEFIKVAPQMMERVADLVAGSMDWPNAEKFAKRLAPPGTDPAPDAQAQLMQENQQLKQQLMAASEALEEAEAQNTSVKAADIVLKKNQAKKLEMEAEAQRIENELVRQNYITPNGQLVEAQLETSDGEA